MLHAICINKKPLIEVYPKVHLLSIVLIKHSYVFIQISLVIDAVEAFTRSSMAEYVLSLTAILVAHALIGH